MHICLCLYASRLEVVNYSVILVQSTYVGMYAVCLHMDPGLKLFEICRGDWIQLTDERRWRNDSDRL